MKNWIFSRKISYQTAVKGGNSLFSYQNTFPGRHVFNATKNCNQNKLIAMIKKLVKKILLLNNVHTFGDYSSSICSYIDIGASSSSSEKKWNMLNQVPDSGDL